MDLLEIRGRLDQIDTQIEKLFEERMRLCSEVAEYKIATGKAVYDAEREKQKIESVQAMACLLYTSPSPRDRQKSRMPSSA